jgi:hypothetical protein
VWVCVEVRVECGGSDHPGVEGSHDALGGQRVERERGVADGQPVPAERRV